MRVCLDCGHKQEFGRYCDKCNATVFEYQHASYSDDISTDEIQVKTEEPTGGRFFPRLSFILPSLLVIVLVPIILILVVFSDSSGNDTNNDLSNNVPRSTPTTDEKTIEEAREENFGYASRDYVDIQQPMEYQTTKDPDWYYDPSCLGAKAICNDGWCSYHQDREKTCSNHGGVKIWLD